MSKSLIVAALTLASASVFASSDIELYGKLQRQECTIKNGTVTRVQSFDKDGALTLTTTSKALVQGVEKYAERAIALTTTTPETETHALGTFKVTMNGRTYQIFQGDSKEALYLVRLIASVCK